MDENREAQFWQAVKMAQLYILTVEIVAFAYLFSLFEGSVLRYHPDRGDRTDARAGTRLFLLSVLMISGLRLLTFVSESFSHSNNPIISTQWRHESIRTFIQSDLCGKDGFLFDCAHCIRKEGQGLQSWPFPLGPCGRLFLSINHLSLLLVE
jgi:hypothetical protein